MTSLRSQKGFTLIELLIVVVIIGILATVLITRFTGAKDSAYLAQVNSLAQQVSQAGMAYQALQTDGAYAKTVANLASMSSELGGDLGQCSIAFVDPTWTISHSQLTLAAQKATFNASTGVLKIATLQ